MVGVVDQYVEIKLTIEAESNLDGLIGRRIVYNHYLVVLIRLTDDRLQAAADVTFPVERRHDDREQR